MTDLLTYGWICLLPSMGYLAVYVGMLYSRVEWLEEKAFLQIRIAKSQAERLDIHWRSIEANLDRDLRTAHRAGLLSSEQLSQWDAACRAARDARKDAN